MSVARGAKYDREAIHWLVCRSPLAISRRVMEEKMVGVGNDDWERGAQGVPCPFHEEDYD
jgi:hypothetical protein